MMQIKQLNHFYPAPDGQQRPVLKDINLHIAKGLVTAIVGPSGSGKSTLSRCLSLLEQASSGEIVLQGQNVSRLTETALRPHRQKIGVIFQSSALLPRRSARENIALPLRYLGVVPAQIQSRVAELLESVGLAHCAAHYPRQLSGGQQQRVGIARALALHPQLLIADEATSGLDPEATQAIIALLKQLKSQFALSVILITHEMDVVRQLADHVVLLSQGEIVEQGKIIDLILNKDSKIGQQLLPLATDVLLPEASQALQLLYSVQRGTPADWVSQVSIETGISIAIHSSSMEQIAHQTVAKLLISIPQQQWQQQQQQLLACLAKLQIIVFQHTNLNKNIHRAA
jgi:D-methionine transport system ATP-binding protein